MSIYDAIANPAVPNIAQAVMQGQQTRQQMDMAPLQRQLAQNQVRLGNIQIESAGRPDIREQLEIERLRQQVEAGETEANTTDYTEILNQERSRSELALNVTNILDRVPENERGAVYASTVAPALARLYPDEEISTEYDPEEVNTTRQRLSAYVPALTSFGEAVQEAQRLRAAGLVDESDALLVGAMAELEQQASPQSRPSLQHPETQRTVTPTTQTEYDRLLGEGYVPVTPVQRVAQGGPNDFTSASEETDFRDITAATRTTIDEIDNLARMVGEADAGVLGFVGGAQRFLSAAAAQIDAVAQRAGGTAEIGGRRVNDAALRDAGRFAADLEQHFGSDAVRSAQVRSNLINLAYLLARAQDPSGRLSDFDIKIQLERMANNGDPAQFLGSLQEIRRSALTNYRNIAQSKGQEVPPEFGESPQERYERLRRDAGL